MDMTDDDWARIADVATARMIERFGPEANPGVGPLALETLKAYHEYTHPPTPTKLDAILDWWTSRLEIEDKHLAFRAALARRLDLAVHNMLQVDYDPEGPLLDAVREAGIECRGSMFSAAGIFPDKVRMLITDASVRVSECGDPWVTIWSASD